MESLLDGCHKPGQAGAAEPALPGRQHRALEGLRRDTNGLPFVPANGLGFCPSVACKDAAGAQGVGHFASRLGYFTAPKVKP